MVKIYNKNRDYVWKAGRVFEVIQPISMPQRNGVSKFFFNNGDILIYKGFTLERDRNWGHRIFEYDGIEFLVGAGDIHPELESCSFE